MKLLLLFAAVCAANAIELGDTFLDESINFEDLSFLDDSLDESVPAGRRRRTPYPTRYPTAVPTPFPTGFPTSNPTPYPTGFPTPPTPFPTGFPTSNPTPYPTRYPTSGYPTAFPTPYPTRYPTAVPTKYPTRYPTSGYPTAFPTPYPTRYPTSGYPTAFPTPYPTRNPTPYPTPYPTAYPTAFPIEEVAVSVPGFSLAVPSEENIANMLANQPAPNVPETPAPTPAPTAGEDEKVILEEVEVEVVKATFVIPITCNEVAGGSVTARAMQGAAEAGIVAASGISADNIVAKCETSRRLTESDSSADMWEAEISVPKNGASTVSGNLEKSGQNGVLMNTIKASAKESGVLSRELAEADPIVAVAREVKTVTKTVEKVVSKDDPSTSTPTKNPTKAPTKNPTKAPTKAPTVACVDNVSFHVATSNTCQSCADNCQTGQYRFGCGHSSEGQCLACNTPKLNAHHATNGAHGDADSCAEVCNEGYWANGDECTLITDSPTAYPTPYPTPYPTHYPTSNPTPVPTPSPTAAPTGSCPVTCVIEAPDKATFERRIHLTPDQKVTHAGRIAKVTHNVYDVNTENSYKQHRCYRSGDNCVCECIDDSSFFAEGAQAGHTPRDNAAFYMPNQGVFEGISSADDQLYDIFNPQVESEATEDDPHDMVQFWSSRTKADADTKNTAF